MMSTKERRKARKKQQQINAQLKKRLFKDVFIAPCRYCRNIFFINELTIEHIVPRVFGGTNEDDNIDLACAPCNQQKGKEAWFQKKFLMKEERKQKETL